MNLSEALGNIAVERVMAFHIYILFYFCAINVILSWAYTVASIFDLKILALTEKKRSLSLVWTNFMDFTDI